MASSNTPVSPALPSDACGLERLRDGKRQGLPWEAAMELMFLADLSVARRALVASAATGVSFPQMLQRFREASAR